MHTTLTRTRRALAALLLTAAAGCHDDALSATSTALTGDWGPATSVVGSRWTMHLVEHGATLGGNGEYALEAGRAGTLAVAGTVAGAQVTLDITYDYGLKEHFVGVHTN